MKIKKLTRRLRSLVAMSCVISLLSPCLVHVSANEVDKLEQETSSLQNELSTLQEELNTLTYEITKLTKNIENTNKSIKKTKLDLVAAKLNEEMQYDAMKKRIKFMYETGNPSFTEMVCNSESMVEFLNKTEFVKNITEYDKDVLQELKAYRVDIAKKEASLIKQQEELVKMQDDLDEQQKKLNSTIASTKGKLKSSSDALAKAKAAQKAAEEALKESEANKNDDKDNSSNKKPSSGGNKKPSSSNSGDKVVASQNDLVLFAALLQCEAGTSNYEGLLAVATVVMNRKESSRFPNTIKGVIYQSGQFSPTWNGSLKRVLAKGPCDLAYRVAQEALNGKRLNKVRNCLFFNASWATSHRGVNVGGNIFW